MLEFTIEAISDLDSLRRCLKEMYLTAYNPYSVSEEMNRRYVTFRDGLNLRRVPVSPSNSTKRYTAMLCDHVATSNLKITDERDTTLIANINKEFQREFDYISNLTDNDTDYEIEAMLIKNCLLQIKTVILDRLNVTC